MKLFAALLFALAAFLPCPSPAQTVVLAPQSRAETSKYEETSRYEDVTNFFNALQRLNPIVRLETFGRSGEGRALPLVILANPPISQPAEARASGKPIVFIMANIHAGEVEGKEAVQHVARRIVMGDLRSLLDKVVILIAPIYNADGNEKISLQNRTDQYGPIGGVGVRENSQRLDLNRDYVKLESPEARALVGLFNRWDPHITVDLHTTDGSYHSYHLTYSIPLNPTVDTELFEYHREKMMPAIQKAMLSQHKFRTYYYGNFNPSGGPRPTNAPARAWYSFSPQPRVGQNYVGFRNRLAILSEAYSHLDFKGRIDVSAALVEEIFKYAATNSEEIRRLTKSADERTVQRGLRGPPLALGVEYVQTALPEPVEILVGDVKRVSNPRIGTTNMIAMLEDVVKPEKMPDYAYFSATRTVPSGRAYLLPPEDGLKGVVTKLREHGIAVEELTAPLKAEAQAFKIATVRKVARAARGQTAGRSDVRLTGEYAAESASFPPGTILIRTAQPLGRLAAYLLEPESDDGLVIWNFLDSLLEDGKTYPVRKLMGEFTASSRPLQQP